MSPHLGGSLDYDFTHVHLKIQTHVPLLMMYIRAHNKIENIWWTIE
jgi:hypothetical protein